MIKWGPRLKFTRLIWLVLLALIWESIARSGMVNPLLLPNLGAIFNALAATIQSGEMVRMSGLSLLLIAEGLLAGIGLALVLAALTGMHPLFKSLVETLTALAHPLPGIALLPLVILWLGTGTAAVVFIIIHSVLWPLLVNMLAGFKAIPPIYREVGANFQLSAARSFWQIQLPAAFPYLLSGVRIGWARAWRAMISAEMVFGAVGGRGGLGWFIFQSRVFMDSASIYAGLIVIILIGMLVEEIAFTKVERLTVAKWGMSL